MRYWALHVDPGFFSEPATRRHAQTPRACRRPALIDPADAHGPRAAAMTGFELARWLDSCAGGGECAPIPRAFRDSAHASRLSRPDAARRAAMRGAAISPARAPQRPRWLDSWEAARRPAARPEPLALRMSSLRKFAPFWHARDASPATSRCHDLFQRFSENKAEKGGLGARRSATPRPPAASIVLSGHFAARAIPTQNQPDPCSIEPYRPKPRSRPNEESAT